MSSLEDRIQRLEDEKAVRDLVARFADSETRGDQDDVRKMWHPDGVLTINEPFTRTGKGVDAIREFLSYLRGSKDFFVQFIHTGVVAIDGDRASARWLVREVAKGGETFYHNYGFFTDTLEKHDGQWLFRERSYHYIYLDLKPFAGDAVKLPQGLPPL